MEKYGVQISDSIFADDPECIANPGDEKFREDKRVDFIRADALNN